MPFYFRKSISAGPFRFNLSGSGLGVSIGVKGFRVGTGPRGHYVHAGRGGVYYRKSLHDPGDPPQPRQQPSSLPRSPIPSADPSIEMVAVSSNDVAQMSDERFVDLLTELNSKQSELPLSIIFPIVAVLPGMLAIGYIGSAGVVILAALVAAAVFIGHRLDAYRRSAIVLYDLEPDAATRYEAVTVAFDALAKISMKWHIDAGGAIRDIHAWKRNAGAGHVVDKRVTTFDYGLPRVLKTNVTPPRIKVGKETLYFLPDVVLVVESGKVGAVAYDMLSVNWQDSRFIEDGSVPRDAQVVGHTWKHPNKSGGPDRRFANNYQIPICLYESIYLTSPNGLNELLQVSTTGFTKPFADAIRGLASTLGGRGGALALPQL